MSKTLSVCVFLTFSCLATVQALENLGCWGDTIIRAIPTLEGQDARLDGAYWTRSDPINKCRAAAESRGFTIFAVQNGGWCASSADAEHTYQKYGGSGNCAADGEGGPWANEVYRIGDSQPSGELTDLGCWGDTIIRAIPTLEGQDARLDGAYWTRSDPINKCRAAAESRGFTVFAVQHGGWCASSADAEHTYQRYGASGNCVGDGEGGPWANRVYRIGDATEPETELENLGCWGDTIFRAISTLEGQDARLDGAYWTRSDPINKCKAAAESRGFTIFAVQNGGWCASSADAEHTYQRYGASGNCAADGEGGPWANQVYRIVPTAPPPTEAPPPPPTEAPPTEAPPTEAPPTEAPPTEAPPTEAPPTEAPPTEAPGIQTTVIPTLPPCEYPVTLRNVAQGKPTTQTSTKPRKDGVSGKAVDGNKDTDLLNGNSCTWTDKEWQPRWEVDLGQTYDIYEVIITNRQDCCPFRIKNAEIRVGDSDNFAENPVCGRRVLGRQAREATIPVRCGCDAPMRGRYVSIQIMEREQMLHLCEVEVMVGP